MPSRMTSTPALQLPEALARTVDAAIAKWDAQEGTKRLFAKDATLFTNGSEASWLGWLELPGECRTDLLDQARASVSGETDVVVLGMGGSSLCPDVIRDTFGPQPGAPRLRVLDSTDPAQIAALDAQLDVARTLFVLASKSGSTLEPNVFFEHEWARVEAQLGAEAGRQFIAVTDPGSQVAKLAAERGFRATFEGVPSVGGRFSALSPFGLVPASLAGVDVPAMLKSAYAMLGSIKAEPAKSNPGVLLGLVMGAAIGRDKLTLVISPRIRLLGAWLEQLIAESLGKDGKAIIPVDGERLTSPAAYGEDRVFVHVRLDGDDNDTDDAALQALAGAGHPVVRIDVASPLDLFAEMYRFEIATAVAGSKMGVNPFDQPDVEASKIETKKLTSEFEEHGALPTERPVIDGDGIAVYANAAATRALELDDKTSVAQALSRHFAQLRAGDYVALLAYVEMSPRHASALQTMRHAIRDAHRVATCVGFGPRFLHSTGQAYKGGPNSGVILQITCDDARDLPVPGRKASFGVIKAAQARGDLAVLEQRGRRALRVHLKDATRGLDQLAKMVLESY